VNECLMCRRDQARRLAVKGVFAIGKRAEWLEGLSVLVVDDVITTGSTVREVASLLHRHGVREVSAVALAHTEGTGWWS
jgi:predicted amidophosphoribosyltransferase